jgi:peptidoglycan/xylan/chitin deacetylase (PgdA/CDA1 family)
MHLRGWKSARQVGRWARSRFGARALILGYHRVTDQTSDPFSLAVSPRNFEQQLAAIRRYGRPVGLAELVEAISNEAALDGSVVLTFDDGYADVLTRASPLLERARIPATVFVIAGLLGREFWWDALWRKLRTPDRLPERLRLTVDGGVFEWTERDGPDAGDRGKLLFELYARLLRLPESGRRAALDALSVWTGVGAEEAGADRALEPDEVVRLAQGGLIEVGAHSSTHARLPTLPPDGQRSEIQNCKADLEGLIGRPVVSFSYPHGGCSPRTAAIVRASGYECACTSRTDAVRPDIDRFQLPRFWVPDWDGERFSRWLKRWLGRPRRGLS